MSDRYCLTCGDHEDDHAEGPCSCGECERFVPDESGAVLSES